MRWWRLKGACAVAALAVLVGAASAQSINERRYTSQKLDSFWQGTLGNTAPDPAWFEILAPGSDSAEPVTDPLPATDFGLPFAGTVIGESADASGGTTVKRGFPVIPLARDDAAELVRRLAWAEIYLSRYRYFEVVSTDGADVLETLTGRQYAAGLEASLISARLYFAGPDLPTKCRHLTRLREIAAGPLAGLEDAPVPASWQALVPIHLATTERLGSSALASIVCSAEPVRTRAETVELVRLRVREQLMVEVRAKVDEALQLLRGASADFQTLVNDMDVPIASAEILELERVLGNAAANMILVKEDQLKVADTIAELQDVDLSQLSQPDQMGEFVTGRARMDVMIAVIDGVMNAMAELAAVSDDPAISDEVEPCAALGGAYSALDLSLDSGTLTRQIEGPYQTCIERVRAVVARFQEPSLEKALMAEMAHRVRRLSETYLATVSP